MRGLSGQGFVLLALVACAHPIAVDDTAKAKPDPVLSTPHIAHVLRGLYLGTRGESDASLEELRLAQMYDRNSAFLSQKVAENWLREGDHRRALAELEAAHRRNPGAQTAVGLAALRLNRGEYREVKELLEPVLHHADLGDLAALYYLDAELWLEQTLENSRTELPNWLQARLSSSKDPVALASGFAGLLEDHGAFEVALRMVSEAEQRANDTAHTASDRQRLELYTKLVWPPFITQNAPLMPDMQGVEPTAAPASSTLENVFVSANQAADEGDWPRVTSLLEPLLMQAPNEPMLLNALGYALVQDCSEHKKAGVWLRRAYRMDPIDPYIHDSLGTLFTCQHNYPLATLFLENAQAALPDDPEVHFHLALLYKAQGLPQRSKPLLLRALALQPGRYLQERIRKELESGL